MRKIIEQIGAAVKIWKILNLSLKDYGNSLKINNKLHIEFIHEIRRWVAFQGYLIQNSDTQTKGHNMTTIRQLNIAAKACLDPPNGIPPMSNKLVL